MQQTRKLELSKQFQDAQIRAASFDEKSNTVDVTWTTGATVTRRGPDGYFDEELLVTREAVRLDRLNAGAPLLDSHRDGSLDNVIGAVVEGSARIVAGRGLARVRLSTAPGDEDSVTKIKDGVVRNISVGYVIHRVEIVEREGKIPIWRVVDWEPLEISAVAVPADAGAGFRAGTRAADERTQATIRTLPYWSPTAARARMLAEHRRLGLLRGRTNINDPLRGAGASHGRQFQIR
jgi:phage head maturation protease